MGGAPFNFIYHINKILGKANFISSVGKDANGKELLSFLTSFGFNTKTISIDKIHPTGTVNVTLDENKVPIFKIASECSFDHLSLNQSAKKIISKETDLLYFGTFTTRKEFSRNTILSLLNYPEKKYFCDLNLRHDFYTKEFVEKTLQVCNVIKINEYELEILKRLFALPNDNFFAINKLIDKFNIELVGLTLGEKGSELHTASASDKFKRIEQEAVIDTLGAGDAFAAILCLGYLFNLPLKQINTMANDFALGICKIKGALPKNDKIYRKYKSVFQSGRLQPHK